MHRCLLTLTCCVLLGGAAAHAADDGTQAIVADAMRTTMSGKALIDDETIRDVALLSPCRMVFSTDARKVLVDWTEVGNLTPRVAGKFEVTDLRTADGTHRIAVPSGRLADRVGSSLTMFDLTCRKPH